MAISSIEGIDHIALKLSCLDEGLRFFRDLMGFPVKFELEYEGLRVVILQAGKVQLEMWEDVVSESLPRPGRALTRQGVNHLAFAVKHLETVLETMREHGYQVIKDVYEPTQGIREAVILGPDNIDIQLVEQNVSILIWRTIRGDFRKKLPT